MHMVCVFHSWYVTLGFCSKYEDFLFTGSILVSKLLKQWYSSRKIRLLFGNYMVVILLHKFDTSVSHMLKGLFTNCDICLVYSYICESWWVPHVGRKFSSGITDFAPFGEFTQYICITECVTLRTMFTDLWLVCLWLNLFYYGDVS